MNRLIKFGCITLLACSAIIFFQIKVIGSIASKVVTFPVDPFQYVSSGFGWRGTGFHKGIDLASPYGASVFAWKDGTAKVFKDDTCGNGIVIYSDQSFKPGQSESTLYCHLQPITLIKTDDKVLSGQLLARVGLSGRTSGPHLHWGLYYDKKAINPQLSLFNKQRNVSNFNQ